MGNEDKINGSTDLIQKGKTLFLPKDFKDPDGKPEVYSLVDAFAQTKKNRSIRFRLSVFGFIAVVIISAIVLSDYIQRQQQEIKITISEFDDINLLELLDSAKKYENELNRAKAALEELRIEMLERIHKAPNAKEKQKIRARYRKRIAAKREEIAEIKEKIDKYNVEVRKGAKKAEAIVGNYKKLHNLKMAEQRRKYEGKIYDLILKYNPRFRSQELRKILRMEVEDSTNKPILRDYKKVLSRERVLGETEFNGLREKIRNQLLILERMLKIPYKNSVDPALKQMDSMWRNSIDNYEELWFKLSEAVRKKNSLIRNYKYAFDFLTKTQPESGYIIDPRDSKNIKVYMNRILRIREGDTGLVFRTDDEYIGRIEFFRSPVGIRAKTIELQESKEIKPFDKILIKIRKEAEQE